MTDQPVIINPSVTPAQVRTALRYIVTFAAALAPGAIDRIVPASQQTLLLSDEFATVASFAVAGAMTLWGMAESWISKKNLVAAANAADDSKFVVKDIAK